MYTCIHSIAGHFRNLNWMWKGTPPQNIHQGPPSAKPPLPGGPSVTLCSVHLGYGYDLGHLG